PGGEQWVDVCALCTEQASERGWLKEGSPTTPLVDGARRRRRFPGLGMLESRRIEQPEPVVSEPMLRRLSPDEHSIVEAAERFNDNPSVKVIVDRRSGPDRRRGEVAGQYAERRETRDRRRSRIPGTFPTTDPPEST